jgi:hypothetical protein
MLALLRGNDMAAVRWRQNMPGNGINRLSDRKLRLFACACARAMGLTRRAAAELILPAELLADGDRSRVPLAQRPAMPGVEWCYAEAGEGARRWAKYASLVAKPHRAHLLREIVGNTFQPVTRLARVPCSRCRGTGQAGGGNYNPTCTGCNGLGWHEKPHPWLTPTVFSLAQAAYEERIDDAKTETAEAQPDRPPDSRAALAFQSGAAGRLGTRQLVGTLDPARLAVLSDALEEAGCDNEAILRHLRGWGRMHDGEGSPAGPNQGWRELPGPHVRGCCALDLILGRE